MTPNATATPAHASHARDRDLRARLLAWYAASKRDLPWRASRDPYRVWISEAMLQQTRVETVIPYYARFLARFPDVHALAAAALEDVLAHWSGLGYYRRARALHDAARAIVADHGGALPRTVAGLRALPGIGPYTAGAVASIAFDQPEPLVDGNVARVLARLFAIDAAQGSKLFRDATWAAAARLVAAGADAGAWNQALMELGAVVCTPRDPDCRACPASVHCQARIQARVADLPRRETRRTPIEVELEVLVVRAGGRILLEQRPADGRMAGLWQLPAIETSPGDRIAPASFAIALEPGDRLCEVRHTITHHRVRARVRAGRLVCAATSGAFAWFTPAQIEALPRTGMTKKIAARVWQRAGAEARARGLPFVDPSPVEASAVERSA